MPTGFADVQVSGAEWVYTDRQRSIVEQLRDSRLFDDGVINLGEIANNAVRDPITWTLAIRNPSPAAAAVSADKTADDSPTVAETATWDWRDPGRD